MSTRWYPLYQRGNPQLRVFLPNFWMKLLKPKEELPSNVVKFACSMEMTNYDVKNYLEKIYKIPVVNIHTYIGSGKFRKARGADYVVKDDDTRIAIVTLPLDEQFKFPCLFPEKKEEDHHKEMKEQVGAGKQAWKADLDRLKRRPGVPTWFGL